MLNVRASSSERRPEQARSHMGSVPGSPLIYAALAANFS
ncbi:hypothetical protein J2W17_002250 [Pseudomonas lini]|nr:hypothetical protein [Pseudomonas lini]